MCYKDYLPRVGQSLMLAGFAVGSVLGGPVADKYGKKPTLLVSLVVMNILGLSVSVSQGFLTYGLLRFLIGSVFKVRLLLYTTYCQGHLFNGSHHAYVVIKYFTSINFTTIIMILTTIITTILITFYIIILIIVIITSVSIIS